jgi:hypothetical protein
MSLLREHQDPIHAFRPISQVRSRPVNWLWQHRLGLGKLAMLEGDPGLGKSLLALDLAARLTTGRPWPDGSPAASPSCAIVLNAEDSTEDTVRPRLEALGADLDRVIVYEPDDLPAPGPLRLSLAIDVLDRLLTRTPARLVIFDPILAFLDEHVYIQSEISVRRALFPLAQLACQHDLCALVLRHLNKKPGAPGLYRGAHSIAFLAACRSAWLAARDPKETSKCVLAQVKNNIAPRQPSLAYQVEAHAGGPPTFTWLGPASYTVEDLSGRLPRAAVADRPRDQAVDFLTSYLASGPRTSRQVWAAAQEQGLAEHTLRRAKGYREIKSARLWADGERLSYWLLPGQKPPTPDPPDADIAAVDTFFDDLSKRYPSASPLDDD